MEHNFQAGDEVRISSDCKFTQENFSFFDYPRKVEMRGKVFIINRVDGAPFSKVIINEFYFDPRDLEHVTEQGEKRIKKEHGDGIKSIVTLDIKDLDCEVVCRSLNTSAKNAE